MDGSEAEAELAIRTGVAVESDILSDFKYGTSGIHQ